MRFYTYATGVLWAGLFAANSFAASNQPSIDLRTAAPASMPVGQPDEAIPPGLRSAVPAANTADLLALVREANEDVYANLESFVCNEEIHRFTSRINGNDKRAIDTVTAKVSFENGVEHYADIRQNDASRTRERSAMSSLAGAWSTGEFGTLLRQTEDLLRTQAVTFRTYSDLNGVPAAVFAVEIAQQDSPWDLEVRSESYRIPFRTDVWVSRASGEILKIERVSTAIPQETGISEIRWGVTLQAVTLNGKTWMLPTSGGYAVLYQRSQRNEWNEMNFSNYHRYGSEVALRFE